MIKLTNKCPRFNFCSCNVCPLDLQAQLRKRLPEEEFCPFCLKKKSESQKGIRTRMPDTILKFVPELNVKLLNKRNQKRWHDINKT